MKKMLYIDAERRRGISWLVETDGTVESMAKIIQDFGTTIFNRQVFAEDALYEIDSMFLYNVSDEQEINHYYDEIQDSSLVKAINEICDKNLEKEIKEQEKCTREAELQTLKRLKEKYPEEA